MRCPSCSKFPSYDTSAEPEVSDLEAAAGHQPIEGKDNETDPSYVLATITGSVRIVLTSECCGDELKEATFDINTDEVRVDRAAGCTCDLEELEVGSEDFELTDRRQTTITKILKSGKVVIKPIKPRYQIQFYGASGKLVVACSCGKSTIEVSWCDEIQASSMDQLT